MLLGYVLAAIAAVADPVACRLPGQTVQCVWRYEIGSTPTLVVELPDPIFRNSFE